jgi:phospholipid/cholesterol/gamma-HCH transport system ATP-binding protein
MDEINRSIGHMAAQTVMKDFATHVQKHLRIIDSCSRCGLNKLMIILSGSNIERAKIVATRLSIELSGNELVGIEPYPEFCFAVSAGFMEVQKGDTLGDLLLKAGSRKDMGYVFRIC